MRILVSVALTGVLLALTGSADHAPVFRKVSIAVGKGPRFIAVADVNGDGKPDLLVANEEPGTVSVLLGDGKGHFENASGSPVAAGHLPNDIAVGDMNRDGHLDLVIANHQSPFLTILLGDGKGGFHPAAGSPFDVHSNPHPHGVVIGAFSSAGILDAVTDSWGSNQIELLKGDGKGGLQMPGRYFAVGRRPYERLRTADFNHDGHPDIVTTNLDDDTATILLSDGRGELQQAAGSPVAAGAKPWQVAIDDFNGDGNADLAIIPYERDVTDARRMVVTVLLGNEKGGFAPLAQRLSLEGCHGPNSIATGDFDGDGHGDIAVGCAESRNTMLFLGHPEPGHLQEQHELSFSRFVQPAAGGWGGIAVADVNGDGRGDLITADNGDGSVTVYLSQ
jgi:hypothetical protein